MASSLDAKTCFNAGQLTASFIGRRQQSDLGSKQRGAGEKENDTWDGCEDGERKYDSRNDRPNHR